MRTKALPRDLRTPLEFAKYILQRDQYGYICNFIRRSAGVEMERAFAGVLRAEGILTDGSGFTGPDAYVDSYYRVPREWLPPGLSPNQRRIRFIEALLALPDEL